MTHTEEVDELIEAAAALKDAQKWLEMKVAAAYLTGTSWAEIGVHLGTSKQTAYNRYSKFVDSLKDEPKTAYTPDEEAEGRAALAALQAVDARKTKEEKASKKLDGKAPAKAAYNGPFMAGNRKYGRIIEEPYEGMARPGTGKGKHRCEGCGHNNHHGSERGHVLWNDGCKPTKYDTAEETEFLNLVYKEASK